MTPTPEQDHVDVSKCTPKPWGLNPKNGRIVIDSERNKIATAQSSGPTAWVNAALIAEAGTVAHETGMSPRQMQAELTRLREKLRGLAEADPYACDPTGKYRVCAFCANREGYPHESTCPLAALADLDSPKQP